jgi:secretion/DNA translocation related TadE-like protein
VETAAQLRTNQPVSGAAGDQGSGTVLAAALLVVVAALASLVVGVGQVVLARHQAEAAADLAALAGAAVLLDPFADADPCARAARVAGANLAELTECRGDVDGSLTVAVAVQLPGVLAHAGPATSTARAGPP